MLENVNNNNRTNTRQTGGAVTTPNETGHVIRGKPVQRQGATGVAAPFHEAIIGALSGGNELGPIAA